jgi:hypothetical protein
MERSALQPEPSFAGREAPGYSRRGFISQPEGFRLSPGSFISWPDDFILQPEAFHFAAGGTAFSVGERGAGFLSGK